MQEKENCPSKTINCHGSVSLQHKRKGINSSPASTANMCQSIGSALVPIMVCRLFGAKALSKLILVYCQLDLRTNFSENLIEIKIFSFKKIRLKNVRRYIKLIQTRTHSLPTILHRDPHGHSCKSCCLLGSSNAHSQSIVLSYCGDEKVTPWHLDLIKMSCDLSILPTMYLNWMHWFWSTTWWKCEPC